MTLPQGWVETTLGQIATFNPKHDPDLDRSLTVSFVPMAAVSEISGSIVSSTSRVLSEVWTGFTHFAENDVIFAKITPCMENGKAAIARDLVGGLACGSTEFYVLRPAKGVDPRFVWRYLRQKSFRASAEMQMTGAVGQRRVPRQYLEDHKIYLPPEAEQIRIINKVDKLSAQVMRANSELKRVVGISSSAMRAKSLLDRLEAAILAKAFRGELVPQDPSDEPASVLLDRIRAERAAAPKPKRGRARKAVG